MNTRILLTVVLAALALGFVGPAGAKLPPLTDEQKAKAEEANAKKAEAAKKDAEALCKAMDATAARWGEEQKAKGKPVPTALDCKGNPAGMAAK